MPFYVQIPLMALVFAFGISALGTALMPAFVFFFWVLDQTATWTLWSRAWVGGLAFGAAYFIYGICIMAVAIMITRLLPRLREGEYAFASRQGIQWFFTGVLSFLVAKTFLDFLLLTGLNVIYFRLMGAKIGKGVHINTKELSDFHMITIGDGTMIGGQSTLIGHVGERGKLKLRPIIIGSKVTVGLGATIFPGVKIGDKAVIGAGAVIPKDEKVPESALYVGVPARDAKDR